MKNYTFFHRFFSPLSCILCALFIFEANLNSQTLCEQFGNLPINQQLGSNPGGIPNTSGLGNGFSNMNILVDGTFTIQKDFSFTNCNIKFTPGSKFVVSEGQAPHLKRLLKLDNSRLYSCSGLWGGIDMQMNTLIDTRGQTQFEDAFIAIIAHKCADLSIVNTIFNRNWIGISLRLFSDCTPVFLKLQGTKFTCTTALNLNTFGTLSHAGIVTRNVPIVATSPVGAFNVRMENLRFGILDDSGGNFVLPIVIRLFQFNNMREDGIQVIRGDLTIQSCRFYNCIETGIDANTIHQLTFQAGNIIYDNNLPIPIFITKRFGVFIRNFAANALMEVSGNTNIISDHGIGWNNVIGFWLDGNTVGAGTWVKIRQCNFNLRGDLFAGIVVNGFFPPSSKVEIYNNTFLLEGLTGFEDADGIRVLNGEKNNIHIYSNNPFDGQDGGNRADAGIDLSGSAGMGNSVKYNTFPFNTILPYDGNAIFAIFVNNFEHTEYCGNYTGGCATHFDLHGDNLGTQIHDNVMRGGTTTIKLHENSFIGVQGVSTVNKHIASGNQWFRNHPLVVATAWAECLTADCGINRFIVNTEPSSVNFDTPSFHPDEKVIPPAWLVLDDQSIPPGCVSDSFTGPGHDDEMKRRIATNSIPGATDAQIWDMERHLYRILKSDTSLLSSYAGYNVFLSDKANNTVGKFWAVNKKIQEAIETNPSLISEMAQSMANAKNISEQLEIIDSLIEISSTSTQTALFVDKTNLQHQIYLTDSLLGVQQLAYRNVMAVKLGEALTLNTNVIVNHIYEQNEKTVNDIWLQSRLFQQDEVNEAQLVALHAIAEQCPKTGGLAIYRARGMLPAQQNNYSDYDLGCRVDERFSDNGQVPQPTINQINWLFPNPADNQITCILPKGIPATLRLFSITGRLVLTANCQEEFNIVKLIDLTDGIYFCHLVNEDGQVLTQKLSIHR